VRPRTGRRRPSTCPNRLGGDGLADDHDVGAAFTTRRGSAGYLMALSSASGSGPRRRRGRDEGRSRPLVQLEGGRFSPAEHCLHHSREHDVAAVRHAAKREYQCCKREALIRRTFTAKLWRRGTAALWPRSTCPARGSAGLGPGLGGGTARNGISSNVPHFRISRLGRLRTSKCSPSRHTTFKSTRADIPRQQREKVNRCSVLLTQSSTSR
jgi:hypothetical protein